MTKRLTCGSLFSGVGGFDLGFERAGFDVRWQVEIDPSCRDVLCRNFPNVEVIYTNVCTVNRAMLAPVDIIIGGFPCQDVSVAGHRAGLGGERSGLFFEFARIIRELRPRFAVFENVPGLLTSYGRRDFAMVLWTLRQLGATDIGWRVLDAQYFNVAQGRERVFIVSDFGGRCASEILSLSEGLRGGHPPHRESGGAVAACAVRSAQTSSNGWGVRENVACSLDGTTGQAVAFDWQSGGDVRPNVRVECSPSLQANQVPAVYAISNDPTPKVRRDISPPLQSKQGHKGGGGRMEAVTTERGIRRFTPLEEERLMSWPDDWTRYGASGKEMSDSTRYRMCGNGVVASVSEWLARRILAVTA
jgi:DNA (cytosine-5)-methyltransferase 1